MKAYPTIEYKINGKIPVYAFDKLDGSNIRAEWTIKNGFHKFGSRRRLLDPNEEPLGEAVKLINGKFETESSGNITLDNISNYAECGVDFISVGALTHQIKSLDLSLKAVK